MTHHDEKLKVTVHYMAAEEPFKDDEVDRTETVEHFKGRVLSAFGLTEGQTPEGNTVTYTLYDKKTPLENPNQTLGEIAGGEKHLQFKLSQQLVQGL